MKKKTFASTVREITKKINYKDCNKVGVAGKRILLTVSKEEKQDVSCVRTQTEHQINFEKHKQNHRSVYKNWINNENRSDRPEAVQQNVILQFFL